jgi:L-lactate dehydrogenase complex protein LldG
MSARDNILGRIRGALGRSGPPTQAHGAAIQARLREHPRGPLPGMPWETAARFKERCAALSSTVDEVADLSAVPQALSRYLAQADLPRAAVCWPELAGLDWAAAGLQVEARPANGDDKVGITGNYCAIAETGTVMLLSGPGTPLASSLLPDTHVAIVRRSRIVRSMEDAWDLLRKERGRLPRQAAFVSGPSRTADIEMTMVLGIHGPYRVHVLLVDA